MNHRATATFAFFLLILFTIVHFIPPRTMNSPPPNALRLVIISDTHRQYETPIPEGDVLIHCGDSELTSSEMDKWMSKLPHKHKLAICGNMDSRLKRGKTSLKHVMYLEDELITVDGVKIYGSPWTPEFVGVFQLGDEAEAKGVWEKVPEDVDVLVTHGPPKGILDRTSRGMRVGDRVLGERVDVIKPRVHCFGHIHESYGVEERNGTLFCNAAVFHGQGGIVVDVPLGEGEAVLQAGGEKWR